MLSLVLCGKLAVTEDVDRRLTAAFFDALGDEQDVELLRAILRGEAADDRTPSIPLFDDFTTVMHSHCSAPTTSWWPRYQGSQIRVSAQELIAISKLPSDPSRSDSKGLVQDSATNELVIAVVGHAGSGTSFIARRLQSILGDSGYETKLLKATDILSEQQESVERFMATSIERAKTMQGHGTAFRKEDPAAIARALALRIRLTRAEQMNLLEIGDRPVKPDAGRRAYILSSLKHPAEVELLRRVYQSSFLLIGIACDYDKRLNRLTSKYRDAGKKAAEEFMSTDEKSKQSHGQQVADTFHLEHRSD
jgi:dephospho-CoA kinase